jgi:hypothetical protein
VPRVAACSSASASIWILPRQVYVSRGRIESQNIRLLGKHRFQQDPRFLASAQFDRKATSFSHGPIQATSGFFR